MRKSKDLAWHAETSEKVLATLNVDIDGISSAEAEIRLKKFGPNQLPPPRKKSVLFRFALQFKNLLIYVLLAAGIVTAILGHWVDSGVIAGVVLINAIIGFIQEGKAERALDAISSILSQEATAIRNRKAIVIAANKLVPGDTVVLQSGDKVPADLRLIKCRELRIDEAMLTGESIPSEKNTELCDADAALGDRHNMAYSGTLVTYGSATGVVIATGQSTEIGRIRQMLGQVSVLETPLLRKVSQFGKWLTAAILSVATITFVFGIAVHDYTFTEMFLAAVGLAVAAIPEGLPAIITITLAIGVQRMAKRNAIIRRLPAVETLGAVTTICSDKTGTLTCNEMTVQSVALGSSLLEVSGVGYDPHGGFNVNGEHVTPENDPLLKELAQAALLCNDANLLQTDGVWQLHGDPTEGALVTLAGKAGLDFDFERNEWPRIDAIPFESEHRFMATLHHDHAGHAFMYLKGAPERLLELCNTQRMRGEDSPIDRVYWGECMEQMAARGQRLLAIAFKTMPPQKRDLSFNDTQSGLTLLGIVGMIDPPRQEAIAAIHACRSAGISVKMITGDHMITARAIATQLGIGDGNSVLSGADIDSLSDSQLQHTIKTVDVFARTSPQHKLRLVTALQESGHVVAMTGDGVNDAPALKRADVGVAMGKKGSSVAKEASEMVLVDDNFASIVNAVEEGRTVYDNIKKSILFILPTNGGEALTIIAAIVFGRLLPITPVQILWVNMVTAITLALALAFEPAEKNVMHRSPQNPAEPLITRFLVWRILFVSVILVTGTFGLFVLERISGADIDYARTVAVNTLVMFEIFYLFNSRYIIDSAYRIESLTGNKYIFYAIATLLFLQILFTYAGPFQSLFGTTALDVTSWLKIIAVSSSVFFLVELEKWIVRRFHSSLSKRN